MFAGKCWVVGKKVTQKIETPMFDKLISWHNLHAAYKLAIRGKKHKEKNQRFMFNLENELLLLKRELAQSRYRPSDYKYFKIFIPKERIISVAAFRDRIVHHALIRVIEPVYEKIFIADSYATRKEKGLHKAIYRAQEYSQINQWYLKLDIKKYFDSIKHDILNRILKRDIDDFNVCQLMQLIIETHKSEDLEGLPVGNLSSQFFGNVYLNEADHFIRHLGIKHYIRYMDDMLLFSNSVQQLKDTLKLLKIFLNDVLQLTVKDKSVQINSCSRGIPFLGLRVFSDNIRVQNVNIKRMKKKIKEKEYLFRKGYISENAMCNSVQSTIAYIDTANTFKLRERIWG